MKSLPLASLDSYQSGARAARAKSVESLAIGVAALAAFTTAAEAQIITPTGPGLQNHAGDPTFNMRVTTLNMTTGATGLNTGNRVGAPAGTWDIMFTSYTTGNSGENSYLFVSGQNAGFGTAGVAKSNNGLTSSLLSNLSPNTTIGPGGSLTFSSRANEYFKTPNLGSPNLKTPEWSNVTGYFAVQFSRADGVHYGWVKLTTTNGGHDITIVSLSSASSPGVAIPAGGVSAIPEPASSAALLALGAAGLVAYRQRKKIQRAA